MDKLIYWHSVSTSLYEGRTSRVTHVTLDAATRRAISEDLGITPAIDMEPWTWQEEILLGVSELMERDWADRDYRL